MRAPDALATARALVAERFPAALAAWLGGSVARGDSTDTSDLDITVLLAGPPAPFRESLRVDGWPVEFFVHTEQSLAHYCGKDQERRQPTIQRLVGESVLLLDVSGRGAELAQLMRAEVAAGPRPLSEAELASARYAISDQLDDLAAARDDAERLTIAVPLFVGVAALALTGRRRWNGTGKGLLRELRQLDADEGLTLSVDLPAALLAAGSGEVAELTRLADAALAPHGGRLFDGHRLGGDLPLSTGRTG